MKKLFALALCMLILFSAFCIIGSAEEVEHKYPYIFVHGMGGWGSYESVTEKMPYWGGWGGNPEYNIIREFNEAGIEAYAASVGPFSSAWDRACELYAQLTGTIVDYGEAHSKAHHHERYGFSYEDNFLMDKKWDLKTKINLVGHSFGTETVRLLASLLAFGDEAERKVSGKDVSPLFVGGHNCVHAVINLAGVHNGSPIANLIVDPEFPMLAISSVANLAGIIFGKNIIMWDLQLSHFGLTPKQNEKRAKFNPMGVFNFYMYDDHCGYDLTLRGAKELNEKIKMDPNAYYYSYTSIATKTNIFDNEAPIKSMFILFIPTTYVLGCMEGMTIDGVKLDKNWEISDGIVPYASQLYPADEADNAYSYEKAVKSEEGIKPGKYYYFEPMMGFDHFDYCGAVDYPTSFEDFYFTMANTVDCR